MSQFSLFYTRLILVTAFSVWLAPMGYAQRESSGEEQIVQADETLAPYFFIESDDPSLDQMPLKKTSVDVSIAGVMAKVSVIQEYQNKGTRPIEAIYVFPASTRAAVFAMRMTIGNRIIEAQIKEREQARQDYEEAIEEGKSATLLEQNRPNVLQMNVANIMPGDVIQVELNYVELLVPEEGTYEFVFPTVVGPRYSETPAEGAPDSEGWIETPYTHEGIDSLFEYNINATLLSGIPIQSITSPSHDIHVEFDNPQQARITLNDTEGAGTKDYILRYNLQGNTVESGILFYPGEEENFFLVMIEPPARLDAETLPPREYTFVLDSSGSMSGFPLNTSKETMRSIFSGLKSSDYFNIITFAGTSQVFYPNAIPATTDNIETAMKQIDQLTGGGGTRLLDALNTVFALPRMEDNLARSIVILTDGYVSFEIQAFDIIRENLNQANLFAGGIGSSPNRYLIEGMAHVGMGEPFFITKPEEVEENVGKFTQYIQAPILTQIQVQFSDLEVYDVEPPAIPDLFAQRPIIVFGKYKGIPHGTVTVSGVPGTGTFEKTLDLDATMENEANEALRYLWARHRIQWMSDYLNLSETPERVAEVTQLGLQYNLLTAYTSFVAVDYIVRNEDGDPETVQQPIPLPDGVSDSAIGDTGSKQYRGGDASVPVGDWMVHEGIVQQFGGTNTIQESIICEIIEIVDTETIRILLDGQEETIRLAGIQSPKSEEPFYEETLVILTEWLKGKVATLELQSVDHSVSHPFRTAYLLLEGKNMNIELVRSGWARYAADSNSNQYQTEFLRAQQSAVSAQRGIWQ